MCMKRYFLSFGTLMLESSEGSREMGFAMAFGILLASLVVSSVLVPAISALAGRRAWWPDRAVRERPRAAEPRTEEAALEISSRTFRTFPSFLVPRSARFTLHFRASFQAWRDTAGKGTL